MDRAARQATIALDQVRALRQGQAGLHRRQRQRLAALLEHAGRHSAFYRDLYQGGDASVDGFGNLPRVTKPALMADFDRWVTDPQITLAGVHAFLSDPTSIGAPFLGRYFVCTTSGTTGQPGLFLHDPFAVLVAQALTLRVDLAWLSRREWIDMARLRLRWAGVFGTGGHFAGEGWIAFQRSRDPVRRRVFQVFSLQTPLRRLVEELNEFQPAALTSYPSALEILSAEQLAGRLHICPVFVETGGETLDGNQRTAIMAAFGCPVHDSYSASECMLMAYECSAQWLHVNSDWVVLEPVEADGSATPPGQPSHTVLLTNLANHVQPLIRYDLGDSSVARPDPCPCGNPLPAIRVVGRKDDMLRFTDPTGRWVAIPPLAISAVADDSPAVHRSQLTQIGPRALRIRLDVDPFADTDRAWQDLTDRVSDYLADQGLIGITLERDLRPTQSSERSGKFRQVTGWQL